MIEPALTAEEWAEYREWQSHVRGVTCGNCGATADDGGDLVHRFDTCKPTRPDADYTHRDIATANDRLPDDDRRKLKAADVEALRRVVDLIAWDDLISVRYDSGEVFADEIREGATTAIQKLAALLPPDDVPRETG